MPATHHVPKTCTGVRQVEAAVLTVTGRAFRAGNTGKPRPPHSGDAMLSMEGSPTAGKFEEVAIVNATGSAAQATLPAVLGALKDEARKLGCNAVIRVRYDRGTSNASATGVAVWME